MKAYWFTLTKSSKKGSNRLDKILASNTFVKNIKASNRYEICHTGGIDFLWHQRKDRNIYFLKKFAHFYN
jgi:hypothetical protein